MIIDLECVSDDSYNCYQNAIFTIASFYKFGYQMMPIGRWSFLYKSGMGESIGSRIDPTFCREVEVHKPFHGVEISITPKNKNIDENTLIQLLRDNIPILIQSDAFACKWTKAFGKSHMTHYFIIYGFLGKSNKFICMDPYLKERYIEYNYKDLLRDMIDYSVITEIINKPVDVNAIVTAFLDDVEFYYEEKTHNMISLFANDINYNMDIEKEVHGYNDYCFIPLLDNISIITLNRKGYLKMLNYADDALDIDFKDVIEKTKLCIAEWEKVKVLLMKTFYTKKPSLLDKVASRVNVANELEIQVFDLIYKRCLSYKELMKLN